MRLAVYALKNFVAALGLLLSSTFGYADTTVDSVASGSVTFAGVEISEAAALAFLIYGFLFLMLIRKRFVG